MSKALQRPTHSFFTKQSSTAPKQLDKYQQWLKREDPKLLGFIQDEAEYATERKAAGLPFKRPNVKGFELRYFNEVMADKVGEHFKSHSEQVLLDSALDEGIVSPCEYMELTSNV